MYNIDEIVVKGLGGGTDMDHNIITKVFVTIYTKYIEDMFCVYCVKYTLSLFHVEFTGVLLLFCPRFPVLLPVSDAGRLSVWSVQKRGGRQGFQGGHPYQAFTTGAGSIIRTTTARRGFVLVWHQLF